MKPKRSGAGRVCGFVGRLSSLALWVTLAGGCVEESNQYTIAMTPLGDSLQRSIRIQRRQTREDSLRGALRPYFEAGMENRLSSVYQVSPDTAVTVPYVARQRFAEVPDDIGTRGYYEHWATPLGESFFYAERVRGMEDPAGWIARRFAAADTLAAVTAAWLRFELVTAPEWPRVAGTMEAELQTIARKYAAVTLVSADEDSLQEGWVSTLELDHPLYSLMIMPLLSSLTDDLPSEVYLARARADLALRMGLRSATDEARVLGFLADSPTALSSYRSWTERAPEAQAVDATAMGRIISTVMDGPHVGSGNAIVTIELSLPRPPYDTNGQWVDSLRCVRWQGRCAALSDRDVSLPLACEAMWSVPDSVMQRRLFGHVVLDQTRLSEYADWFTALTPARQAAWNRMLLTLRPGRLAPLDRFHFGGERDTSDAAAYARDLIRTACEETR